MFRHAPFTVNIERLKPFHTLTGLHALQSRPTGSDDDLGQGPDLPAPAGHAAALRRAGARPQWALQMTVRYLTLHSKRAHSIPTTRTIMLSLSRGGATVAMSPEYARRDPYVHDKLPGRGHQRQRRPRRPGDRHRMPQGVVYVHHVGQRTIDVPKSEVMNGVAASTMKLSRLLVKPTHLRRLRRALYTFRSPSAPPEPATRSTIRKRSQEGDS